ncbi:hypothetical protein VE26_13665 [Devosia chinhatensis]|uniref:YcxB-like C-terminal domain-containing protein n=2 Tax=Devosia chinhatensis TaxID=429727 RepID=A0A0F5FFP3_9HYPH|nr:hypothetical protein VE26_13665 [Devosia chinhatensis]
MVVTAFDALVTSAAAGAMIALACLPLLQYFVLLPYQARRIYRHQKSLHYPVQAAWSDRGYSASSGEVSGTTSWNDFYGWSADARIILFMQSPVFFQMLPRRALSDEQAERLFADLERSGLKRL